MSSHAHFPPISLFFVGSLSVHLALLLCCHGSPNVWWILVMAVEMCLLQ